MEKDHCMSGSTKQLVDMRSSRFSTGSASSIAHGIYRHTAGKFCTILYYELCGLNSDMRTSRTRTTDQQYILSPKVVDHFLRVGDRGEGNQILRCVDSVTQLSVYRQRGAQIRTS